ncbi:hypothetical protein ACIF8T_10790 [Streptomyces sp. NPDC085946]
MAVAHRDRNRVRYAVVGDTGPRGGGTGSGVTYILFAGARARG